MNSLPISPLDREAPEDVRNEILSIAKSLQDISHNNVFIEESFDLVDFCKKYISEHDPQDV